MSLPAEPMLAPAKCPKTASIAMPLASNRSPRVDDRAQKASRSGVLWCECCTQWRARPSSFGDVGSLESRLARIQAVSGQRALPVCPPVPAALTVHLHGLIVVARVSSGLTTGMSSEIPCAPTAFLNRQRPVGSNNPIAMRGDGFDEQ